MDQNIIEAIQFVWNAECLGLPVDYNLALEPIKLAGNYVQKNSNGKAVVTVKGLKALFSAKGVPVAG